MLKKTITFTVALSALSLLGGSKPHAQQGGTAAAKQCLHGSGETEEQAARRREALTATRTINNIQANRRGNPLPYLRQDELAAAPFAMSMKDSQSDVVKRISLNPLQDILPGWKLTLDVSEKGYWFMIKDATDPCGYVFISNQNGVIFTGEALR